MKIGLDLDFTISELPQFFAILSKALIAEGHEVHIITYREKFDTGNTIIELNDYGIAYTQLHIPDHNNTLTMEAWKAEIAKIGLDLMIDDSPEVLHAMPPNVKRLWMCDPQVFNLKTCIMAMRAEMRMDTIK